MVPCQRYLAYRFPTRILARSHATLHPANSLQPIIYLNVRPFNASEGDMNGLAVLFSSRRGLSTEEREEGDHI